MQRRAIACDTHGHLCPDGRPFAYSNSNGDSVGPSGCRAIAYSHRNGRDCNVHAGPAFPDGDTTTYCYRDATTHRDTHADGDLSPETRTGQLQHCKLHTSEPDGRGGEVGVFPYFCTIHPAMIATVTVVEAGAELVGEEAATPTVTPQPTATPTPTVTEMTTPKLGY